MNILILGSGGREHALAWRLSLDESAAIVYVWPGNAGITGDKIQKVSDVFEQKTFADFLKNKDISLVIPGSEKYLYEGVSDWSEALGVTCFGPSKLASQLEQSKIYSKALMLESNIPTAPFRDLSKCFAQELNGIEAILREFKQPVIKVSGPSLGKGVFVCNDSHEATTILHQLKATPLAGMEDGLLVEEGVFGKEISVFFACNGLNYTYLGSAQDHKRLLDSDKGPNTGGMGAVSPVLWADEIFIQRVTKDFLMPTLKAMQKSGNEFKGILFLGLMVDGSSINLLEYNVRFGDPETQVILPLIEGDFAQFLYDFSKSHVGKIEIKNSHAVHVVKAARGYPGLFGTSIEKGEMIQVAERAADNSKIFFAGVKFANKKLVTDGGRVLGVTTWGANPESARSLAYKILQTIHFNGEQYRSDIGEKI